MSPKSPHGPVLTTLVLLSLAACAKSPNRSSAAPAVPVTVAQATERTVPVQVRAIGSAEPLAVVAVRAQVSAQLMRVHFTEGQDVAAGDLLFTLDRRPFETSLQQVQANVARDEALAANAKAEADRAAHLIVPGLITKEQYDQAMAQAKSAAATVQADRAAVASARLELDYCTIRAPMAGRTGSLMVNVGNLVKAEDVSPLVVINTIAPIYVSFAVPERRLAEIQRYFQHGVLPANASIPGGPGEEIPGQVSFVDNQVDRATGTIRLKAIFANTDHRLWPGQYADVTVTLTERPTAVLVPAQAIQTGQGGSYVYVVGPDQKAAVRQVNVGDALAEEVVIEKGLAAGETVVTDGQLRLGPGVAVTARGQPQALNEAGR